MALSRFSVMVVASVVISGKSFLEATPPRRNALPNLPLPFPLAAGKISSSKKRSPLSRG
jgi:hypothetical protein